MGDAWKGHALKFVLKFKDISDQCLFVKVPGNIGCKYLLENELRNRGSVTKKFKLS